MSKWISVSEKLPKKSGEYLCTLQIGNDMRIVKMISFAKNLYKIDRFDFYEKKGKAGFFDFDNNYGFYEISNVIAWDKEFKLPDPYRGESEGET